MEEYDIIEIQGKHGIIRLHVPKREATKEEVEELYKSVAEIAVNIHRHNNRKKAAEK